MPSNKMRVLDRMTNYGISQHQSAINTFVMQNLPAPCRTLTPEEIAKEYGERATRPIPPGYKSKKFRMRPQLEHEKKFFVARVFDTERREYVKGFDSYEAADKESGRLRDAMTDDECGKDYTYLPFKRNFGGKR